jgi:hypothetical protein
MSLLLDTRVFVCGTQRFVFPDFGPLAKIVEAGGLINYTKFKLSKKPFG